MNIGFYGHSICAYRSDDSFIDKVEKSLAATIVNIGARQGSEERILYELKKTKKLDLAIIFHCPHNFIFIPGSDRDFAASTNFANKAGYIWEGNELNNSSENWEFHKEHHEKFIQKFETMENFIEAMTVFRKIFYDPDLTMNRYYGAITQIDQYVSEKKIKTIHVTSKRLPIPRWFNFSSGIVDYSINEIANKYVIPQGTWFVNGITKQGNEEVAQRLLEIIAENKLTESVEV